MVAEVAEEWPLCDGCYYFRGNECQWDVHSTLGVDECYVPDNFSMPLDGKLSEFKPKDYNKMCGEN